MLIKNNIYFIGYIGDYEYNHYAGRAKYIGESPEFIGGDECYQFEILVNGIKKTAFFPINSVARPFLANGLKNGK